MTLVIEAASVVIPIFALDLSYPGGAEAYILAASEPRWQARYVLYDDHLTAVSFADVEFAERWGNAAARRGNFMGTAHDRRADVAFVDQRTGPQDHVEWLDWEYDADGVTWASHRDDDGSGIRVAPPCWTLRDSRKLIHYDARDDANMKALGTAEGTSAWLNTDTGTVRAQEPDDFVRGVSLLPKLAARIRSSLTWQRREECVEEATLYLRATEGHVGVAFRRAEHDVAEAQRAWGFGGPMGAQAKGAFLLALLRDLERTLKAQHSAGEAR